MTRRTDPWAEHNRREFESARAKKIILADGRVKRLRDVTQVEAKAVIDLAYKLSAQTKLLERVKPFLPG